MIGAAIGGPGASHFGVTGPFWFAFAGSGVFVMLMWRQLTHITHDEAGQTTVKHESGMLTTKARSRVPVDERPAGQCASGGGRSTQSPLPRSG